MNASAYDEWLHSTAICILGHRGSGKSSLAYDLLTRVDDNRPIFVFDHPLPDLIESRGWHNMYRLEEMYRIHNCVVFVDEPQLVIPKLDKRANDGLQKLLSIARHRDITLIMSTCDSRWVTRALEAYVDVWLVKDCEARLLKAGSLAKRIIQKFCVMDTDEFRLDRNEFLYYCRDYPELDGVHTFRKPPFFSEKWSKPWALADLTDDEEKDGSSGIAEPSAAPRPRKARSQPKRRRVVAERNGSVVSSRGA